MLWFATTAWALTSSADPAALCALADAVVVAEVTSTETEWAPGPRGDLRTRSWGAVSAVLMGTPPSTVEILSLGGTLQGLVQHVEHEPTLRVDHRYVLLLSRDGDAWRVTGGEAGLVPLAHGAPAPKLSEVCHAR